MKYNNIILKYNKKQIDKFKRIISEFLFNYKNIIFYVDSREQDTFIINKFKEYKLKVETKKCKYGDFGFYIPVLELTHDDVKCCYERKKDINEIIGNLNEEKDNFGMTRIEREIYCAISEGYDFKFVCGADTWNDIYNGNYNKHTNKQGKIVKMNNKSLIGRIRSIESDCKIKLEFIDKEKTMLKDICTFFYYSIRTYLLKYCTVADFEKINSYNKEMKKYNK